MPQITINVPAQVAPRLQTAITRTMNLSEPAGLSDVKALIIRYLKRQVEEGERLLERDKYVNQDIDLT